MRVLRPSSIRDNRRGKDTPADAVILRARRGRDGAGGGAVVLPDAPVMMERREGFRSRASTALLQLLTLKTLGINQIKQAQSFGDIGITRTVRGSKGVRSTPVLTPRCRLPLQAQLADAENHIQKTKGSGALIRASIVLVQLLKERIKPCYPRAENKNGVHGT